MAFTLFILVNAALFIRPGEIIEDLDQAPIYLCLIMPAIAASLPRILAQLRPASLVENPIAVCVLGVLAAVVLSHLLQLQTTEARERGYAFAKVVAYYFLLLAVIDTPERLRSFLAWLVVMIVGLAGIAVLQYHGYLELTSLTTLQEWRTDPETGARVPVLRLRSVGLFNDPNDICLMLSLGTMISFYWMGRLEDGSKRWLWLGPAVLFLYAIYRTQSRGGLLGLLAGLLVLARARYGWKKAAGLALLAVPVLLAVGGRQTAMDVTNKDDTGQGRIQLWSEALTCFRGSPLIGVGAGMTPEVTGTGLVPHNSFVQAFTELGLLGGGLFVGAFYLGLSSLEQFLRNRTSLGDPEVSRLAPYVYAALAAYATGLLSLSRVYVEPSYLALGLTTVYLREVKWNSGIQVPHLDRDLLVRLGYVSLASLAGIYAVVRLLAQWG